MAATALATMGAGTATTAATSGGTCPGGGTDGWPDGSRGPIAVSSMSERRDSRRNNPNRAVAVEVDPAPARQVPADSQLLSPREAGIHLEETYCGVTDARTVSRCERKGLDSPVTC